MLGCCQNSVFVVFTHSHHTHSRVLQLYHTGVGTCACVHTHTCVYTSIMCKAEVLLPIHGLCNCIVSGRGGNDPG